MIPHILKDCSRRGDQGSARTRRIGSQQQLLAAVMSDGMGVVAENVE